MRDRSLQACYRRAELLGMFVLLAGLSFVNLFDGYWHYRNSSLAQYPTWHDYPLIGVFGFESGVFAEVRRGERSIPLMRGSRYAAVTIAALGVWVLAFVLFIVPVWVAGKPVERAPGERQVSDSPVPHGAAMAGAGLGLVLGVYSAALLAPPLELLGLWRSVAFIPGTTVLHSGMELDAPRYWPVALMIALAWPVWAVVIQRSLARPRAWRRVLGWLTWLATLSAIGAIATFCHGDPRSGFHTGFVVSAAVFLWSIGGLSVLAQRWHPPPQIVKENHCGKCGYDLRGTLAARRHECPECGAHFRPRPSCRHSGLSDAGRRAA